MITRPENGPLHIAVVEDDPDVAAILADMLTEEGYVPHLCAGATELDQALAQQRMAMLLLDLKLADGEGLSIAARMRASYGMPIIILTGRGSEIDRVVGLEVGADDYIVKPFSIREVAARIRAVLRRSAPAASTPAAPRRGFRFEGWVLDLDRRRLAGPNGNETALSVAEFDLLAALLGAHGRVLSRDQLLDLTRRDNDSVTDRTVDVLVLRLRRKIEINPAQPRFILTERSVGYTFGVPTEKIGDT
ncbi:response regulator transcription factor [Devosia sp.]|uniref:winged helix-turn-helix domain-containing protein n=1 Tax=Devosia sp. TaxID=1871048 RepID=UPI001AD2924E|nr:response regulator transcription factor [Devosia sp.]MBN9334733.1 response regulator transcription factor [Devosia sp.]